MDWRNARFVMPGTGRCPARPVRFVDGIAESEDGCYRFETGPGLDREIVYADLTGDGHEDALLMLRCGQPDATALTVVVAVTVDARGVVLPLGTVFLPDVWTWQPVDLLVWHGDIALRVLDLDTGRCWTRYHRWSETARDFVRLDGG
ncbi:MULTISPECIES: hypothetical protein [Actinoalloteichus]|uniref:Uncharacterized protein n=1 Tax=Actinoalloteichus fjordicus TaxID=1612552 RepID=A0AAC9PUJ0_9PSEU|nr:MULTISPECIES: hypothetical protein [Actinoalloteichus]APU17734.1 hypothetical protein UA74_28675 [Actinoalloteichus fjordicus]APU23812.1 hypothetical protein UA75_29205 [Actinoalloteichus sp. GBA129-24]